MKSDNEVIDAMIDTLQAENGWCKGTLYRDEDGVPTGLAYAQSQCLLGALERHTVGVKGLLGEDTTEEARQMNRLQNRIIHGIQDFLETRAYTSIPGFNDRNETTKEDVILMLKHTREQDLLSESSSGE